MRLSVSDTGLAMVLKRFKPKPGAHIEFVISPDGLDVIANADGYLTLARWCLVMAHPEMGGRTHPRWLYSIRHLDEAVGPGDARLTSRQRDSEPDLSLHAVRFFRAERRRAASNPGVNPTTPREVDSGPNQV
ncbi:MAG: hypothetical protein IBX63_11405 [Coriobacteriia bacterium]|nr:hypothetical protein [Coriobacteriia bacterium]